MRKRLFEICRRNNIIMSKRSREEVIEEHSMGESLEKYIELKVNDKIYDKDIQKIIVRGKYIRDDKQIKKEKNKRFNYKRPTIEINRKCCIFKLLSRYRLYISLW